DLPLALGGVAVAVPTAFAGFVLLAPARAVEIAGARLDLPLGDLARAQIRAFLGSEATATVAVVAATLAVLVALRFAPWRPTLVAALALVVVSGDLLRVHRSLVNTTDAEILSTPPPIAAELPTGTRSLWSSTDFDETGDLVLRGKEASQGIVARSIERLDPWTGILWCLRHVLTTDYSLTLTPPARRSVALARRLWDRREREPFFRLLGSWGASSTIVRKTALERLAEVHAGVDDIVPARVGPSPFAQEEVRFATSARSFANAGTAEAALLEAGVPLGEREFLVGAPWDGERRFAPARLRGPIPEMLDSLVIDVEAPGEALLDLATTWDPRWHAELHGRPLPVLETAAGYLAVVVPGGGGPVRLHYRDPWLRAGAALSALSLLGLGGRALLLRRRRRAAPAAT
ncbi:MAG TPA: hypothetical protein VLA66_12930, partial [Thermoanaerobaculia bacterium]|nr:hypothetical protein [Thermoanaerobaculia bacterium]